MEVMYGESSVSVPVTATNTTITTYLWNSGDTGVLGEFDHMALTFNAWELAGPTTWIPRPDIITPPTTCIGIDTTPARKWQGPQGQEWILLPSSAWRLIRRACSEAQVQEVQYPHIDSTNAYTRPTPSPTRCVEQHCQ